MTKAPGRPKSADPKLSLPIRVRASILAGFPDATAARAAIEALVERHLLAAGPSIQLAPAPKFTVGDVVTGFDAVPQEVTRVGRTLVHLGPVRPLPDDTAKWPSGATVEHDHTEDPASKLSVGSAVTFGYQRPKPGERQKKPKR